MLLAQSSGASVGEGTLAGRVPGWANRAAAGALGRFFASELRHPAAALGRGPTSEAQMAMLSEFGQGLSPAAMRWGPSMQLKRSKGM